MITKTMFLQKMPSSCTLTKEGHWQWTRSNTSRSILEGNCHKKCPAQGNHTTKMTKTIFLQKMPSYCTLTMEGHWQWKKSDTRRSILKGNCHKKCPAQGNHTTKMTKTTNTQKQRSSRSRNAKKTSPSRTSNRTRTFVKSYAESNEDIDEDESNYEDESDYEGSSNDKESGQIEIVLLKPSKCKKLLPLLVASRRLDSTTLPTRKKGSSPLKTHNQEFCNNTGRSLVDASNELTSLQDERLSLSLQNKHTRRRLFNLSLGSLERETNHAKRKRLGAARNKIQLARIDRERKERLLKEKKHKANREIRMKRIEGRADTLIEMDDREFTEEHLTIQMAKFREDVAGVTGLTSISAVSKAFVKSRFNEMDLVAAEVKNILRISKTNKVYETGETSPLASDFEQIITQSRGYSQHEQDWKDQEEELVEYKKDLANNANNNDLTEQLKNSSIEMCDLAKQFLTRENKDKQGNTKFRVAGTDVDNIQSMQAKSTCQHLIIPHVDEAGKLIMKRGLPWIDKFGNILLGKSAQIHVMASTSSRIDEPYEMQFIERVYKGRPIELIELLEQKNFTEIQKECDDFEYHRMEMEVYRCNLQQWEMLFQEAKENYLFGSATLYQLIQTVYSKERAWMMEKMISSEILNSKELPEAFYEIQPAGWKQATPVFKYFLECLGQGVDILCFDGSTRDAHDRQSKEAKKKIHQEDGNSSKLKPGSIFSHSRLDEVQDSMVVEERLQLALHQYCRTLFQAFSPTQKAGKNGSDYHLFRKGCFLNSKENIKEEYFMHRVQNDLYNEQDVDQDVDQAYELEYLTRRVILVGVSYQVLGQSQWDNTEKHGPIACRFILPKGVAFDDA